MKPSDRIKQLCKDICARAGAHQPSKLQLADALPMAIVEYLDEEHASRPHEPPATPKE